jgi:AcrR family transcriptional regulator
MATKGEQTRDAILEGALRLASRVGLEGLSIGMLAEELELSKSGLFAHFGSKEALQLRTIEYAAERFSELVVRPALATTARGEPRLHALFDGFLRWPEILKQPGGCVFVAAAVEFDDRPGPVRDRLREFWKERLAFFAGAVRRTIEAGHFRRDVDPEQFAFQVDGIALSHHYASRLLGDAKARAHARAAFEALVAGARPKSR